MQLVSPILTRWIVIYPVDSVIQRLNNRGLAGRRKRFLVRKETSCLPFAVHLQCCNNIISVSGSSVYIVAEFQHCSIKTESAFYEFTSQLNPFTTSCFPPPFIKWTSRKMAVHCRGRMYQFVRIQSTFWKWSQLHTQRRKPLSFTKSCKMCSCFYENRMCLFFIEEH